MAYATEQSIEIAGKEHLECMVFHPEPLGYTDAVGGGKLLGEMLINGAVQFIQLLLADAGEYA